MFYKLLEILRLTLISCLNIAHRLPSLPFSFPHLPPSVPCDDSPISFHLSLDSELYTRIVLPKCVLNDGFLNDTLLICLAKQGVIFLSVCLLPTPLKNQLVS